MGNTNTIMDRIMKVYNNTIAEQEKRFAEIRAEQDRKHEEFMNSMYQQMEEQNQAYLKAFEEMLNQ